MSLTEEEKQKIIEEEEYRQKVREQEAYRVQLRTQPKGNSKDNHKKMLILFGILLLIGLLSYLFNEGETFRKNNLPTAVSNNESPAPKTQTTFVASVNFTGTQFVVSNLDSNVCENAKMQVNSDYELNGYTLESGLNSVSKSGDVTVYKVGAGQFAKKDGTRFNPYSTKPQNFFIECRGNNMLTGAYYYGTF
jgi:hypothetical protein